MRPYSTTMMSIGKAKNRQVDSSHSGNPSGLLSMAQNAESRIFSFAVKCREMKQYTTTSTHMLVSSSHVAKQEKNGVPMGGCVCVSLTFNNGSQGREMKVAGARARKLTWRISDVIDATSTSFALITRPDDDDLHGQLLLLHMCFLVI